MEFFPPMPCQLRGRRPGRRPVCGDGRAGGGEARPPACCITAASFPAVSDFEMAHIALVLRSLSGGGLWTALGIGPRRHKLWLHLIPLR